MMNYVAQKHTMSCGIAAVANRMQISYERVTKVFDMRYADGRGYTCKSIVIALKKLGKSYRFVKVTSKTRYLIEQPGSIVFIGRSTQFPCGHWLARIPSGWADSWINLAEEENVAKATAGLRSELPGNPEWVVYEV